VVRSAARPWFRHGGDGAGSRLAIGREALDAPCRCAGADAGGATGREAFDAGTVASGDKIKPGEPGEALYRGCGRRAAPLDVPCRCAAPMPVARSAARPRS
jgi:hypothetical protein